jgi:hypothetical protein
MGKEQLKHILRHPTTDSAQLQKIQEQIQELIAQDDLRQEISNELVAFAFNESALYNFTDKHCSIADTAIKDFYFQYASLDWLNKSPVGLELGHVAGIANLFAPIIEHAALHFLISEKLKKALGICCSGHSHEGHDHQDSTAGSQVLYDIYNITHMGIHAIGIKGMIEHVIHRAKILKHMQTELIRVGACLQHATQLHELLHAKSVSCPCLTQNQHTRDFFELDADPELYELRMLLKTNTFTSEASYFSRPGTILRAYALMQKNYEKLVRACAFVGDVDARLSCALLYAHHAGKPTTYCFAEYQTADTPAITIEHLWNPLMKQAHPLAGTMSLATSENPARIMVVTGPNKAGKTTGLSSFAVACILAQTIGMAPATHMALTPLDAIRTALNMSSRVKEGQSLFSASIDFAQAALELTAKNPTAKIMVVIDELFNSTQFELGQKAAYKFIERLAASPCCLALVATHFHALTELETAYPLTCKNFKAETRHTLTTTEYAITPGVSEKDVFDLVGDHEFIKDAFGILA